MRSERQRPPCRAKPQAGTSLLPGGHAQLIAGAEHDVHTLASLERDLLRLRPQETVLNEFHPERVGERTAWIERRRHEASLRSLGPRELIVEEQLRLGRQGDRSE